MKEIISPVETADGLFHDGDPSTGAEGTVVHAKWLNAMQGAMIDTQTEHKNILAAAGMQPKAEQNNQITEAINSLILQSLKEDGRQSLLKKNNGADIPDKTAFVKNLGLSNTVEQAQNALDKRTGGTISGALHVTHSINVGDVDSGLIANGDGSVAFYAQDLKTGEWNKDRLHWVQNLEVGGKLTTSGGATFGSNITVSWGGRTAIFQENGDVVGPIWGGALSAWLNNQLNSRGTKNTAHKAPGGWWKCGDTGFMIQWGRENSQNNESFKAFPTRFSRECFGVVLTPQNGASSNNTFVSGYSADGFKVWTYNSGADFLWVSVGE